MNPDLPAQNRAIGWYRFMLWMLPWSIAAPTCFGAVWLESRYGGSGGAWLAGWLVVSLSATAGIGALDDRLKASQKGKVAPVARGNVLRFMFLQIFIIPWFAMAVFFAVCSVMNAVS